MMTNARIKILKKKIAPALKKAEVVRLSLFGSYARGEQKNESDIDFLVELKEGKTLLDLARLKRDLEALVGNEVDVVTYRSVSPHLKKWIETDEIPLYGEGS